MKTTTIALLVLGGALSASPTWADIVEHATKDQTSLFGQPARRTFAGDFIDASNRYWPSFDDPPSLGLENFSPAGADLAATVVPQTESISTDNEETPNADIVASLILIGLGGAILIGLRWRMSRSFQSHTFSAR